MENEFELINKFMGAKYPNLWESDYENDIEELMSVVDRIGSLLPGIIATNGLCDAKIVRKWATMSIFTPREKVYKAVVEFVKWYISTFSE